MIIKGYTKLNDKEIKEVKKLEKVCNEYDNLNGSVFLDTSMNFNKQIQSVFLLYEKRELVSVLAMFIPTEHEAEICAVTLPKYRSSGYFKTLLFKAAEELRKFNIPKVLLVCERQAVSAKQVLNTLQAELEHTEYFLRLDRKRFLENQAVERRLSFREAENADLARLIRTSMSIFEDSFEDAKFMIENTFKSDSRKQYLGLLNGEIVGLVSASEDNQEVSIFGFGILPEFRSKGYGKELLYLLVGSLLQSGKTQITLEVDSENEYAFELYKKSGFRVEVAYEYYQKMVAEIGKN